MRMLLAILLVASCADDSTPRGCPDPREDFADDCRAAVETGDSCDYDASGSALAGSCYCEANGFWTCNSCPFSWTPVDAIGPCTPGATCEINSWEHGCSCGCTAAGEWACTPLTINSQCPE